MQLPQPRELIAKLGRGLGYLAAFFVIAAIINVFQSPDTKSVPATAALELKTLAGERVTITTNTGKKTLVYFFAPWCAVCKISMDAVDMFAGKANLQAIAVGLDYDNPTELKPFAEKRSVPVYAGGADLQQRFKVDRYPTVYILNGDGTISHVMVGYTSRFGIWIRTLLFILK